VLNPAFAVAIIGVLAWRKLMYSLIWQSVMWRPGKLKFLIGVKNPLPIDRPRPPENRPLAGPRRSLDSRLQSGYALLSSHIRRHFLILIDARFSSPLSRSTLVGDAPPEHRIVPHREAEERSLPRPGDGTLFRVYLQLETALDETGQACYDPPAGLFAST
jgi:hypothetical protein